MAVADFVERIERAGPDAVAFLYYSGHGAADRTERGENYLIPIGAKIALAKQLPILGVSLSEITRSLEHAPAKARFVVVDACRDVAFTKGIKDAAKGLVPERKLEGMIVAFATRPGETADDNNIYASALASILPTPGLEAEQVFKETQRRVADLSKGRQIPWTEDGLLTRFKFKEAALEAEVELAFWTVAKTEGTVAALQTYLLRYPGGTHSQAARLLIDKIHQEEASRAALHKKGEEEALATRQQEERIAAERREAEERARQEAEAIRQAALEPAKKKAEEEAQAKRQQAERIAAERREAEERARREGEAERQAAGEVANKKAEEKSSIVVAALPPGAEALATAKRTDDTAAEQAKLVHALQTELKRVGCDPGEVDGVWGDKAKAALGEFGRLAKVTLLSDAPSAEVLQAVLGEKGRICPAVPKVIQKPTRRVADQPTVERSRQVQKGEAARSTPKLKCGYHWGGAGAAIGQQRGFGKVYSCD
jgi:hypothetical protein